MKLSDDVIFFFQLESLCFVLSYLAIQSITEFGYAPLDFIELASLCRTISFHNKHLAYSNQNNI